MQRLPSEDVLSSSSSGPLAVDLTEAEEPLLDDEELLDEPFLATDDGFDATEPDSSSSAAVSPSNASKKAPTAEIDLEIIESQSLRRARFARCSGPPCQRVTRISSWPKRAYMLRYGKT